MRRNSNRPAKRKRVSADPRCRYSVMRTNPASFLACFLGYQTNKPNSRNGNAIDEERNCFCVIERKIQVSECVIGSVDF